MKRLAKAQIKRAEKMDAKIAKNVQKIRAAEAEKIAKATKHKES